MKALLYLTIAILALFSCSTDKENDQDKPQPFPDEFVISFIEAASNDSQDSIFIQAMDLAQAKRENDNSDFVSLFGEAITELDSAFRLATIFATYENRNLVTYTSTNNEIIDVLQEQIREAQADEYFKKGIANDEAADFEGAIKYYTKAIELDPTNFIFYTNRASSKGDLEDYEGAIKDCNRAIELNPDDLRAYLNRERCKSVLGNYRGALQDCNKAIMLDPNLSAAYYMRGMVKIELGDKNGACLDLSKAQDLGFEEANEVKREYCMNQNEKVSVFHIGEAAYLGDYMLKVITIQEDVASRTYHPEKGNKFIAIEVLLKNIGDSSIMYSALYFDVQDEDHYLYSSSLSLIKKPEISGGVLQTGRQVRGWVSFEVKETAIPVELIFYPDWFDYGQIIIELSQ
ncbi:MAG: tetratricopeptide repeat protein [Bacteroidetes bacterium]|nr:tetratricopeptide repeat protein [Bacteroidota bacterium]